jgi:hypothetical protein
MMALLTTHLIGPICLICLICLTLTNNNKEKLP